MKPFRAYPYGLGVVNSALFFLAALSVGAADSKTYLNFDAGVNLAEDIDVKAPGFGEGTGGLKPGFRISAAQGFVLSRWFSLEVETGFVYNRLENFDGSLDHIPILGNLVFQYDCECGWTPFIGAGGGGAVSFFEETVAAPGFGSATDSDTDFVLAWQGQAGLRYRFSEGLSVGLVYKYFGTDGPKIELFGFTRDIQINHNHYLGVQLSFRF